MFEPLLTEQGREQGDLADMATAQILQAMNAADAEVAAAVGREIPRIARAVDAIAAALGSGGRLFYTGAGTSGRLGVLDASECPPTFGVAPDLVRGIIAGGETALTRSIEAAEDDSEAGGGDLMRAGFLSGDVVVGISASGRTPYVLGAVARARQAGGITCGISCVPDSELSRAVEFPMEPAPGPEILAGSTRLRAGTATKLVLNMISTAVMIRLGLVYRNRMVNVQPSNEKLRDRARRIVRETTGCTAERAAALLEASGGKVAAAIVMERLRVSAGRAEQLLAAAHGRIADALKCKEKNG